MKILKSILLTAFMITVSVSLLKGQNKKSLNLNDQMIEKLLIDRHFAFTTYFVGEASDGKPLLSPDYSLNIFSNKILAELPGGSLSNYSNLAFTSFATYIKLNSTNYYYKAEAINNVGWRVSIVPINDRYVKSMILNINKKGGAVLAILNNRSKVITYNGDISALNDNN